MLVYILYAWMKYSNLFYFTVQIHHLRMQSPSRKINKEDVKEVIWTLGKTAGKTKLKTRKS